MTDQQEDVLSDVLRLIRLQGCVYFLSDFSAPWGMAMDSGPVAQFHMVVRGQCWLKTAEGQQQLSSGDVVVFPFGDGHSLADDADRQTVPGRQVLAAIHAKRPLFQDGDKNVSLLCGHFEFDRELQHPLLQELPRLIHVRGIDHWQPGWLDMVSAMLVGEAGAGQPGRETVIDRLAEVLLVQVLRVFLLQNQQSHGFLAALTDQRISSALKIIHSQAQNDLTLAEIAKGAGMSRSNLAARFKAVLGSAPMAYLATWRMLKAKELLKVRDCSLAEVSEHVGYTSEAAFSRAFKRAFNQSPSAFRRSISNAP